MFNLLSCITCLNNIYFIDFVSAEENGNTLLSEHGLKQSIVWIESILDAHLNAIAVSSVHNEETRGILKKLLLFIADIQQPLTVAESVMSASLHITRMATQHGQNSSQHKSYGSGESSGTTVDIESLIESKAQHRGKMSSGQTYAKGDIVYIVEKLVL